MLGTNVLIIISMILAILAYGYHQYWLCAYLLAAAVTCFGFGIVAPAWRKRHEKSKRS